MRPQLDLCFRRHPDRGTYLQRRVFGWPYTLSRGFHLDTSPAGMLTLIVQTVSGAIQADDALLQRMRVEAGAAAHVTTQGATMIYRAPSGLAATDTVELDVADGALIEYLPEPRILFPDADLSQRTVLRVAETGVAIVSDAFIRHDPRAQGRGFRRYASEIVVERPSGEIVACDRIDLEGAPAQPGRRARFAAHGTLLVVAPMAASQTEAMCADMAARVAGSPDIYAAASPLPAEAGVVMRLAATDGRHLRTGLAAGWFAARQSLFGAEPASRRKDAA